MAKNTTLKTRIQNRHDTEANWTTASNATKPFIPLKGEVIVYDPDTTNTSPRVKIGDGVTKVGNLAFVGGDLSKYLTSSDLANYVTTNTTQTIDGQKTFTKNSFFNGRISAAGMTISSKDNYIYGELTVSKNAKSGADATGDGRVQILNSGSIQCTENTGSLWTQVDLYDKAINFMSQDYPLFGATYDKILRIVPKFPTKAESDTIQDLTLNIPFKEGTLATLDDIPSIPTNYVTTDTAQTISGVKTFTGAIQLQGVGIAAKVGGENSSYTNILKGGGNVVEVGSTSYLTRIYSNGRISVYDYSTSPSTSEKVAYQSEIPTNYVTTDTEQDISAIKHFKSRVYISNPGATDMITLQPDGIIDMLGGGMYTFKIDASKKQMTVGAMGTNTVLHFNPNSNTVEVPNKSGTIALTSDIPNLSIAPIKVKDTFVASSWATSSAATDTQFGKYYKDVTIPNKNIINVRCVSTKGMSGITLDYAPEIKCNNRRTSDTNLRIYSNSQLEGAITITLVGDTLPNKFSKTNATLSTSSWTTSSATVDTQFAKYYTDITVPAGDVMNIRILSNEDITGISTAAYYPEVWSDNRKINSTTLRVYSNKQVAGSVIILTMEV